MPRGPSAHVKKIFCKSCELMYASTAGAMEKHAQVHRQNGYVRIGRKKDAQGRATGDYRPEQHLWNHWTGRYYYGSDAKGWRNVLPRDALFTNRAGCEFLRCRKCKTYKILFNHNNRMDRPHDHSESLRISKMVAHESACKPKEKKENQHPKPKRAMKKQVVKS